MCTSLTMQTLTGNNFLGRTMDFAFELEGKPVFIPKNYLWKNQLGEKFKTKYGFVGTGRKLTEFILADGINEKGLAIAELYFSNEAKYFQQSKKNYINFAPHELIFWILGEIATIEELEVKIKKVNLVALPVELLNIVVPLHFIITDRTGKTVVLETNNNRIELKENPIGVLTNSPEFEWHLKNLNNYIGINPQPVQKKKIEELNLHPFGQGSGTFGLPGGNTSPERFIRTVYNRAYCEKNDKSSQTLNTVFQLLNIVSIPRGVSEQEDGLIHHTQYFSTFDLESLNYYYSPSSTQEIFELSLPSLLSQNSAALEFCVNSRLKTTILH
ncbi:choloylglycine hydrolase family protein [Enterococcus faecalis]|uniref:choloylglycine hydrolase family protein n=1 Tax=Enterococcus faecalis TaxID=1351 RepID=UPI003D76FC76